MRKLAVLATLAAAGVFAGSAAAVPPDKFDFSDDGITATLSGVCSFDVEVTSSVSGTEIDYFDSNGNLTRVHIHINEQDVFTANGKSLTGVPYTFNIDVLFDSEGNVTHVYSSGVTSRIILPGGDLFLSAGRVDFVDHPDAAFLLSPDHGAEGNIAGFCAALSP